MPLLLQSIAFQSSLQFLLTHLLAVYYPDHRTVCVLRTATEDIRIGEHSLPQVHLLLDPGDTNGSHRLLLQAVEAGCGGFVVTERVLLPFLDRFHAVHSGAMVRSADKRLIGVIAHLEGQVRDKLLAHEALESLVNVLLLVPNESRGTVALHTTRLRPTVPIGIRIELVQIAELTTTGPFPSDLEYFPDKISNMEGRRLRVASPSYPPCTAWTEVPLGEGNAMDMAATNHSVLVEGFELVLTLEFCRRYNCSLELALALDWGYLYENGTTTGLLYDMTQNRADLFLGAIYEWQTWWQLLSITAPIGISSVSCLVPKPKLLPFWETPFMTFPPSLWAMVGVAFLAGTLGVFAVDLYRHHRIAAIEHRRNSLASHRLLLLDALFYMAGLYVEQSVRLRNDLLTAAILLTTLLFGGFMIGNSYAGALASIMTLPRYEKPIDTAADFVARRMRWTASTPAWLTSLVTATDPSVIRMRDSLVVYDADTRARLPFTDDHMGHIYERFQYGNYGFGTRLDLNSSRRLQPMTQILFREYTAGYCSKVWPLQGAYDRFILELHQTGILYYMELTSIIRLFGLSIQRNIANARAHEADGEPVTLSMDHFLGVFFILFCGLTLASIAFVAEHVVYRWNRAAR